MIAVGVLGQDPTAAIAALSWQLIPGPEQEAQDEGRFVFHDDALKGVLYVGLPWPQHESLPDHRERTAQEAHALSAALLLFLASHAIVWVQPPGTPPDARMLATLRLLQQAKQLLLPALPELVEPAGAQGAAQHSMPWEQPPLLLCACQVPPGAAGALTPPKLSQAQAQLDSQLRSVFRRCRVVLPEEHPAALCTLRPQAQGATCMLGTLGQSMDSVMQRAFEAARGAAAGGSDAPSSSRGGGQGEAGAAAAAGAGEGEGGGMDTTLAAQLRAALQEHATGAGGAASFPAWRQALSKLAAALQCTHVLGPSSVEEVQAPGGDGKDGEGPRPEGAEAAAAWLAGCSSLLWQVSESRCQRALAAAREAYLRGVPEAYPPAVHAAALQSALSVYASLARGPASLEYEGRVRAACEEAWRDGRQRCQATSVYGRPCILAPHDPQEVPHSSGTVYRLATPDGQQQALVADPFPRPAGLTLGQPVQPGPASLSAAAASVVGLEGTPVTATRAAVVGLLVRQEGADRPAASAGLSAAAASAHLPAAAPALVQQQQEGQQQVQGQGQQQGQQGKGALPSESYLEVYVLGPGKTAQAGLEQPGVLPGSSNLHRFVLQVSQGGAGPAAAEEEEFPALGPAQQHSVPSVEPEVPRVYNWPLQLATGTGVPTAAIETTTATPVPSQGPSIGGSKATAPQERRRGKKGAVGRRGGPTPAPPSVWVGLEYESLLGHRVVITPAHLAACTASSLDPVHIAGDQEGSLQPCPLTDALADASSEALGAAAAAAAAAKRAGAAGPPPAGAAGAAGALPLGGPAAQLMLSSTLPLFLHLSPEQLGAGRPKPGGGASGKGAGAGTGASKALKAELSGLPASGCWWQLRRVFVGTPSDGELAFECCPLLQFEVPGVVLPLDEVREAPALASSAEASSALQHRRRSVPGAAAAPGQGTAAAAAAAAAATAAAVAVLTYQPQQPVRLPPDSLCCIALPWLYTLPTSSDGGGHSPVAAGAPQSNASAAGQGSSIRVAGAGGQAATGSAGAAAATPLLWSAGPLRAVLVGGTVLKPSGLHG